MPESRPQQVRAALDLCHGEVLILYIEIESYARPLVQTFLYSTCDEKSARPTENRAEPLQVPNPKRLPRILLFYLIIRAPVGVDVKFPNAVWLHSECNYHRVTMRVLRKELDYAQLFRVCILLDLEQMSVVECILIVPENSHISVGINMIHPVPLTHGLL